LAKNYPWNPGAVVTPNHDYNVYSEYYKDNLLNYDSRVVRFGDDFEWLYDQHFIRPCLDSKVFTGQVLNKEEWPEFRHRMLTNGHTTSLTEDTLIQIASPKNLTQEVRCWVVDGKIVTQSTYRRGSFLVYDEIVDQDVRAHVHAQKKTNMHDARVCVRTHTWYMYAPQIAHKGCLICLLHAFVPILSSRSDIWLR
jgi:hypothetical protein